MVRQHPEHDRGTRLGGPRVLVDCRWIDRGGAGRATELLLRGLARVEPRGTWILWGPDEVRPFLWSGTVHVEARMHPKRLLGQAALLAMPRHDVAIFLHQIRPFNARRSITLVHDTIPLHFGSSVARRAKRLYYGAVVRASAKIFTVSHYSRRSLERDLPLDEMRVQVVHYPLDCDLAERVGALRGELTDRPFALYVGSFATHKNLRRLVLGFGRTRFARKGGRLVLVGGDAAEAAALARFAADAGIRDVETRGGCSQRELDRLYAEAQLVALPSLEEGFGLPAWEALACGVPVCVSRTGALAEVTRGLAATFDPEDLAEIARAIDRAAAADPPSAAVLAALAREFTLERFARPFVDAVAELTGRSLTPEVVAPAEWPAQVGEGAAR